MLPVIQELFRVMLLNLLQLAAGCLLLFAAAKLKTRGFRFDTPGKPQRIAAVLASSLAGMILPLGPFGAIPCMAAGWMLGLELPLILPLFVSGMIFNLSIPLTKPVFVWGGSWIRIAAAFAAGALCGLLLSRNKTGGRAWIRNGAWSRLFAGVEGKAGYFGVLREYIETSGLYVVAGCLLTAAFTTGAFYWLQNTFFSMDMGLKTMTALSTLNVFNPAFSTAVQILNGLADFTALAAALLLFKVRHAALLVAFIVAIALVLAIGIFF